MGCLNLKSGSIVGSFFQRDVGYKCLNSSFFWGVYTVPPNNIYIYIYPLKNGGAETILSFWVRGSRAFSLREGSTWRMGSKDLFQWFITVVVSKSLNWKVVPLSKALAGSTGMRLIFLQVEAFFQHQSIDFLPMFL